MNEWQELEREIQLKKAHLAGALKIYRTRKKELEDEKAKLQPMIDEVAQLLTLLGAGYTELAELEEQQLHTRGGPNDR